jgi:hypothetical protein
MFAGFIFEQLYTLITLIGMIALSVFSELLFGSFN